MSSHPIPRCCALWNKFHAIPGTRTSSNKLGLFENDRVTSIPRISIQVRLDLIPGIARFFQRLIYNHTVESEGDGRKEFRDFGRNGTAWNSQELYRSQIISAC